jgi:hypothetical protein
MCIFAHQTLKQFIMTDENLKDRQSFVNQKLQFVEDLVLHTDAHIFLTGKAGTGKTTFLKSLPAKTHKRMVVVAPTGVAAINAGGQTIHSFFQLPFGPQLPEGVQINPSQNNKEMAAQYQKIRGTKLKIMRTLDLLVIDEISMVRADVLDAVDAVLRRARRSSRPFGGVQVLMIGDVHQLAPVAKPEEWEVLAPYYRTVYFFGSHVLQKTDYLCVELDHIYRQHDQDFINLLNKVRDNRIDADCIRLLNSRYIPDFKAVDGYITLTTHNVQADQINESRLRSIDGKSLHFTASIKGNFPTQLYPTKEDLELKIGAQVMFVKNDPNPEKAYYNGKIGKLTGYDEDAGELVVTCGDERINVSPVVWQNMDYTLNEENQQIEEREIGSFTQIPLRLAWAVTIHKSQGLTFDKLVVDAQQAFAHGQVYVALSRCTSLEGLVLKTRITSNALIGDGLVDYFVEQMPNKEPSQEKVDVLRKEYELTTMSELIDFHGIYCAIGRLAKVVMDNLSLFEGEMVQELVKLRDSFKAELVDVGQKFKKQIQLLHQESVCEANHTLQERLQKGAAYFKEHLQSITEKLQKMPFKTDNKTVNEQIADILKQLKDESFVKMGCLESCDNGFRVEDYYKVKSIKLLEVEKTPKSKYTIKEGLMEKSTLYAALNAWRADKAEEEDTELYSIIPSKTLKAISKEKPVTIADLRQIEGIGSKRIKAFGREIVNIVRVYSGMEMLDNESAEMDMSDDKPSESKRPKGETYLITKRMLDKGMTVEEIAAERGLALSTIYGHIARFVEHGEYDAVDFVDRDKCAVIEEYFRDTEDQSLTAAREVLGEDYEFWELRMVLAGMQGEMA